MEINLEVCRTLAIHHGLPLQFVIKEFHLFHILSQVALFASQQQKRLIFKGGTALSKVYLGKIQRFSEDLDFDLDVSVKAVEAFSHGCADSLSGYFIKEFRKVNDTIQFYCGYGLPYGGKDHVRVDIASKKILTAFPVAMKPALSEFTQATVSGFLVYALEDLVARKMYALAARAEGKDLYDVFLALPLCSTSGIKKALGFTLRTEGKKMSVQEFLSKTLSRVVKLEVQRLRDLTNPFIPLPYRPKDWGELKGEVMAKLEMLLKV